MFVLIKLAKSPSSLSKENVRLVDPSSKGESLRNSRHSPKAINSSPEDLSERNGDFSREGINSSEERKEPNALSVESLDILQKTVRKTRREYILFQKFNMNLIYNSLI